MTLENLHALHNLIIRSINQIKTCNIYKYKYNYIDMYTIYK